MPEIRTAVFETPDGVKRPLRFTKAAQYRMSKEQAANGGPADYFILWAMMFDEEDDPPTFASGHQREGQVMTSGWLGANLSPMDTPRVRAAIAEATTGAVLEKKIVEEMEKRAEQETQRLRGLIAGLSLESTSGSQDPTQAPPVSSESSGGAPLASSTRSVAATQNGSATPTSAPV